jgi:hypothetical protein
MVKADRAGVVAGRPVEYVDAQVPVTMSVRAGIRLDGYRDD